MECRGEKLAAYLAYTMTCAGHPINNSMIQFILFKPQLAAIYVMSFHKDSWLRSELLLRAVFKPAPLDYRKGCHYVHGTTQCFILPKQVCYQTSDPGGSKRFGCLAENHNQKPEIGCTRQPLLLPAALSGKYKYGT